MGIAGREMENQRTVGTRGNQMNLGGPSSPGLSDKLRSPPAGLPRVGGQTYQLNEYILENIKDRERALEIIE